MRLYDSLAPQEEMKTPNLLEEQPGRATLFEHNGVFTVTDGEGLTQYTGNEVGAEFAFWRTTFGVPVDDSEVRSE